jgi:hypothetical protein
MVNGCTSRIASHENLPGGLFTRVNVPVEGEAGPGPELGDREIIVWEKPFGE